MKEITKNSQTSNLHRVLLQDSSSTTGGGLTGLTSASGGLIISTVADNEATAKAYTVAGSLIEGITTLGAYAAPTANKCRFKEVDAVNHPGLYELQFADARYSVANAKKLIVTLSGATNLAERSFEVQLSVFDLNSAAPDVNMAQLGGATQSAADLKDFADAGYDPATNKVQGVVLVDTTAANSDMRGTDGANTTAPLSAAQVNAECDTAIYDYHTTVMSEAYAADGAAPTPEQMQFMLWSALSEFAVIGTTITCKRLDGSTAAMTFTLDSDTDPTSRTRAS